MTNVLSTVDKEEYQGYQMQKVGEDYIKVLKPFECTFPGCKVRFEGLGQLSLHLDSHDRTEYDNDVLEREENESGEELRVGSLNLVKENRF